MASLVSLLITDRAATEQNRITQSYYNQQKQSSQTLIDSNNYQFSSSDKTVVDPIFKQQLLDLAENDLFSSDVPSDVVFKIQQLSPPYIPILTTYSPPALILSSASASSTTAPKLGTTTVPNTTPIPKTRTVGMTTAITTQKLIFALLLPSETNDDTAVTDLTTIAPGSSISFSFVTPSPFVLRQTKFTAVVNTLRDTKHQRSVLCPGEQRSLLSFWSEEKFLRSYLGETVYFTYYHYNPVIALAPYFTVSHKKHDELTTYSIPFLNHYLIPITNNFIFDIKSRGLMDRYYDWQRSGQLLPFTARFSFGQSQIDIDYDYRIALARYVAALQFPLTGSEEAKAIHNRLNSITTARLKLEKIIHPDLKAVCDSYEQLFKKLLESSEDRSCNHVIPLRKLLSLSTNKIERQQKAYLQLKEFFKEDLSNRTFDITDVQSIAAEIGELHCRQCQQKLICSHKVCIMEQSLRHDSNEPTADDDQEQLWNLLSPFIDSFFSDRSSQRFVCRHCAEILFPQFLNLGSAQKDRNIYSETELLQIRHRVSYITSFIDFPKHVNVERTLKGLEKVIYTIVYDDAQWYIRRTTQEYLQKLTDLCDIALSAYISLLGNTPGVVVTRALARLNSVDENEKHEQYRQLLKKTFFVSLKESKKNQAIAPNDNDIDPFDIIEAQHNTPSPSTSAYAQLLDLEIKNIRSFEQQEHDLALITALTDQIYKMKYVFPQQSQPSTQDIKFSRQNEITIAYIYGTNGLKHEWKEYVVESTSDDVQGQGTNSQSKNYYTPQQLLSLKDYKIIDRYSRKTDTLFSQLQSIPVDVVKQALLSREEFSNVIQFFLFDCPLPQGERLSHDLDDNKVCRVCGYHQTAPITDPSMKTFYEKYKKTFHEIKDKKQAEEKKETMKTSALIQLQYTKPAPINSTTEPILDLAKTVQGLNKEDFNSYCQDARFSKELNINKMKGLISNVFALAPKSIDSETIQKINTYYKYKVEEHDVDAFIYLLKTTLLVALNNIRSIKDHIIEFINVECGNYKYLIDKMITGFSIYYNDFTDQATEKVKIITEKEQDKEEYGVDTDVPAFDDEEVNEDDTSLP